MPGNSQTPTFRATGYRFARNSDKMPAPAGGLPISFWDEPGCGRGGIEKVFTSSRVERTMEQQMGRGILCWSTIALLAVGSCGNNSFAGPLEDGLAVPVEDDACTKEVVPLRKDAEERGELIRAASARRAPPDEACKLINGYAQSEIKLIRYFETNAARCGIPPEVADQLKVSHKNTEAMRKTVCAAAQQAPRREPAGPVGDFDDVTSRRVR
jgi:hypothetical protein